jgi:hypothetical protein
MATWKKVIVSGSSANLANVQVDSLTQDQVVIGGGSGNLTTTAINGTGNIVATTNATGLTHSGSFSGSFEGDGTGLTGVVATIQNPLTDGAGISDFSYDGSTAGILVSVDSGSLAGNGLTTAAGKFVVTPSSSLITVDANGVGVSLEDLTVDNATLQLDSGTTYDGGVAKTISVKDGGIDTDAIADSLGTIGVNSFTGSFSGSFSGDVNIDLADLTAGDGLFGTTYDGNDARTFSVDSGSFAGTGLGADATGLIVNVDDTTIEINTDTLRVKDGGISNAKLVDATIYISGSGISNEGSVALGTTASIDVQVDDSTIEISSDALKVKDGGIGTAQIADSLGNINENSFTGSFSGSFVGDGSGLIGTGGSIISGDAADNQVAVFNSSNTIDGYANFTFNDSTNTLTVTGDQLITGDLTVQGTASFQHETNLDVADRFIRLASGSSANGDGGIVIQQNLDGTGEVFGFDNPTKRFGVSGSFDAATNTFTPDAFMAAVVEGGGGENDPTAVIAKYTKKGNMFVASNEDIYIYS